jgi:phenylpropionate dioxygenase-like ring-hydroxylating dioxygenase large terminal subunit
MSEPNKDMDGEHGRPELQDTPDTRDTQDSHTYLVPAQALLGPPAAKVRASVVKLPGQWFILTTARELGKKPLEKMLMGIPLVLFRDDKGRPGALLDRCPHRNVPLSLGAVVDGQLQCAYHGWRFDTAGSCRFIPSLCGDAEGKARNALSYPAVEQDGFIWVYSTPGLAPDTLPYRFALLGKKGYTSVRQVVQAESTMHAALENALDVPHTQFLHSGLFRAKNRGIEITAIVRRSHDRVVAEYVGEPRPMGLVARILSPSGGLVTHFDRFILPSIAEVEYSLGQENHLLVAAAMTPISDFCTQISSVTSFRLNLLPGWLVRLFLKPLALRIFYQDASILKRQSENIRRFAGEQFASTEIDVLGRHIWRLLRGAERGEGKKETSVNPVGDEIREEQVKLLL